jgi:hypothetical protein
MNTVVSNGQLSEMGLQPMERQMPSGLARPIKGRTGKILGEVQHFTANMSAKALKEQLKAQNPKLSGKALAVKVNEVLRGEVDVRQQLGMAWLTMAFQNGWTADVGILRKNRGGLNLVRVDAAREKSESEKRSEAMAVLGLSEADFEVLKQLTAGTGN